MRIVLIYGCRLRLEIFGRRSRLERGNVKRVESEWSRLKRENIKLSKGC